MSSIVEICNMALSHIGNGQRIDALDEASEQAEQCSLFYETSRDFVLRDHPWGFATAFADLAQVASNPDPIYLYAYAVPTDCLKVRQIVNTVLPWMSAWPHDWYANRPNLPRIPYRIINGSSSSLIATNVSPAKLEYTLQVTSSEMFEADFVSALSWYLAAQIAPSLSKDPGIAQTCQAAYQAQINQAVAASLNEGTTDFNFESSFITGRC